MIGVVLNVILLGFGGQVSMLKIAFSTRKTTCQVIVIPSSNSFSDAKDLPLTGTGSGIVSGSMQLTKSLGLKLSSKG